MLDRDFDKILDTLDQEDENKDIEYNDFIKRPQALSRFDCNVFPFGKIQNN